MLQHSLAAKLNIGSNVTRSASSRVKCFASNLFASWLQLSIACNWSWWWMVEILLRAIWELVSYKAQRGDLLPLRFSWEQSKDRFLKNASMTIYGNELIVGINKVKIQFKGPYLKHRIILPELIERENFDRSLSIENRPNPWSISNAIGNPNKIQIEKQNQPFDQSPTED